MLRHRTAARKYRAGGLHQQNHPVEPGGSTGWVTTIAGLIPRTELVFVQILTGHIVLRYFVGVNFLLVSVISAFDTGDDVGFECIPFLD